MWGIRTYGNSKAMTVVNFLELGSQALLRLHPAVWPGYQCFFSTLVIEHLARFENCPKVALRNVP